MDVVRERGGSLNGSGVECGMRKVEMLNSMFRKVLQSGAALKAIVRSSNQENRGFSGFYPFRLSGDPVIAYCAEGKPRDLVGFLNYWLEGEVQEVTEGVQFEIASKCTHFFPLVTTC